MLHGDVAELPKQRFWRATRRGDQKYIYRVAQQDDAVSSDQAK